MELGVLKSKGHLLHSKGLGAHRKGVVQGSRV